MVPPPERAPEPSPISEEPARKRKGKKGPVPVGLIPVTVRLKPEIASAIKRASLERKLAAEETYTQQDLVELALETWLKGEGRRSFAWWPPANSAKAATTRRAAPSPNVA